MMRNRLTVIFCLVFFGGLLTIAYRPASAVVPDRLDPAVENIGLKSFDFSIETFEYDGTAVDSITTIHENKNGLISGSSNGGKILLTPSSVFLNVMSGSVSMNLIAYNGTPATFTADAGSGFEFEPDSFTVTASPTNKSNVYVHIDETVFAVHPGESTRFVDIDILPVIGSLRFNPKENNLISVIILGSAHLDVSRIDIGSLFLEKLDEETRGKAVAPAAIENINADGYPDLVVDFEANNGFFQDNIRYAIVKGTLSDGTLINGKANMHANPLEQFCPPPCEYAP